MKQGIAERRMKQVTASRLMRRYATLPFMASVAQAINGLPTIEGRYATGPRLRSNYNEQGVTSGNAIRCIAIYSDQICSMFPDARIR
jgi:hypothetical protein